MTFAVNSREANEVADTRQLPPLPEIGHPEPYYARQCHLADREGDSHRREAFKVGQYVSLALDPHLSWPEKLKYFQHALKRHCVPPPPSRRRAGRTGCGASRD